MHKRKEVPCHSSERRFPYGLGGPHGNLCSFTSQPTKASQTNDASGGYHIPSHRVKVGPASFYIASGWPRRGGSFDDDEKGKTTRQSRRRHGPPEEESSREAEGREADPPWRPAVPESA